MIYEVILHLLSLFRVCFTKLHNPRIVRYSCISYSAPSAPRRIVACRVVRRFILHTRASKEPLAAGWLANWPLVASLGSPPISRFFGWLVGRFVPHRFLESLSQLRTETHRHSRTHTHTDRHSVGVSAWLLLLLTFLSDFFFSCFFLALLVQFRRRRRHVVAYFPIYEIICCAKTILLGRAGKQ